MHWSGPEPEFNPSPSAALNHHLPDNNLATDKSPVALQHNHLSPSHASFAAVRWFGLLASDAARDSPQLRAVPNAYANQNLALNHSGAHNHTELSSLQHATQVLDCPHPGSSVSQDPADNAISGRRTLGEEQLWQAREPIELLPAEQTLFEHFVHQVSPWV